MAVNADTGEVALHYQLDVVGQPLRFTETFTLPLPAQRPTPARWAECLRVLELLHIAAGTSYYKVCAPARVVLPAPVTDPVMRWASALFRNGLAEFAYRNDLPYVLDLEIVAPVGRPHAAAGQQAGGADLDGGPVVNVGGGKDSLVSVEVLRTAGLSPVLLSVNPNQIIDDVLAVAGLPSLAVRRRLDPLLFELNADGAYNGHIPVTAINSLAAVATAVLHGRSSVVMSNERSASVGNLGWHGREVNHQWAKSLAAERLLREALTAQTQSGGRPGGAGYFSLLRGLSELAIARLYSRFDRYDAVMTSCNRAYTLTVTSQSRWCADCPKCRFVFLALAPFVSQARLLAIFGTDMFADLRQLAGFGELCGLTGYKPFECVGEVDECLVALRLASEHPQWTDAPVVRALREQVPADRWPTDELVAMVLAADGTTPLPAPFAEALAAFPAPPLFSSI